MLTSNVSGHVRVVPADALPLLKANRLDPRLFDVTGLLNDGYDDRRADLPVIASTDSGVSGTVVRRMTTLKANALHTRKRDLGQVWSTMKRSGSEGKVWLDAIGHFTGAEGVQQIGATEAWQAGLTGKGMTVALIDSGVDVTHPDLAGQVTTQMDFTPVATGDDGTDYWDVTTTGSPMTYQAGRKSTSEWNAPIVTPCPASGGGWTGDQLTVRVAPYCDKCRAHRLHRAGGRRGYHHLYRDGKQVATSDIPGHALFTAPQTPGTYRLDVDSTRATSFGLSSHVTADWTFTDPAAAAHLPAIRMTPPVNGIMPITANATAVSLQVSTEDCATWHPATVTRTGTGTFQAKITTPTSGYVSVKVTATGGTATATETVMHAYQIGS